MLEEPMLAFVRTEAPLAGNFRVGLPDPGINRGMEGVPGAKRATLVAEKKRLRDYLLSQVVRPLIEMSSSVLFFGTSLLSG